MTVKFSPKRKRRSLIEVRLHGLVVGRLVHTPIVRMRASACTLASQSFHLSPGPTQRIFVQTSLVGHKDRVFGPTTFGVEHLQGNCRLSRTRTNERMNQGTYVCRYGSVTLIPDINSSQLGGRGSSTVTGRQVYQWLFSLLASANSETFHDLDLVLP